jgi:hypothetical protein
MTTIADSPLTRTPFRHTEMWKHQDGSETDIFVMDMKEGHLYQLNATAASLWMLMDGQRTVEQIIATCLDEFQVDDPLEAQTALLECMGDLEQRDLIFFKDPAEEF